MARSRLKRVERKLGQSLEQLGPGLVTGAADDDPSGIATYTQAGAQFGYGMGWTLLLTYPLMVGIQLASARIGRTTGRGLTSAFATLWPRPVVLLAVLLLLVANVVNLAADMRREVRDMLLAGKTDQQIRDFMVSRYGYFILFKPPFVWQTAWLWLAPGVMLLAGVIVAVTVIRKRAAIAATDADDTDLTDA